MDDTFGKNAKSCNKRSMSSISSSTTKPQRGIRRCVDQKDLESPSSVNQSQVSAVSPVSRTHGHVLERRPFANITNIATDSKRRMNPSQQFANLPLSGLEENNSNFSNTPISGSVLGTTTPHSALTQLRPTQEQYRPDQPSSKTTSCLREFDTDNTNPNVKITVGNNKYDQQSCFGQSHTKKILPVFHNRLIPAVLSNRTSSQFLYSAKNSNIERVADIYRNQPRTKDNPPLISPSTRTLANVDLNGIKSHVSTLQSKINNEKKSPSKNIFQLPASCILPRVNVGSGDAAQLKVLQDKPSTSTDTASRNLLHSFDVAAENDEVIHSDSYYSENEDLESIPEEYLSDDMNDNMDIIEDDSWIGYLNAGNPDKVCQHCTTQMWNAERNNKSSKNSYPTFSICCRNGQVELPPERAPPPFLSNLLAGGPKTEHYKKYIRIYNSMYAFTSLGGKIDYKINRGRAPWTFKLSGQNYHLIGSICPVDGEMPKYCQLYVYDTENEVENRKNAVPGSEGTDPEIVDGLLLMLNEHNTLVQSFRMARDRFKNHEPEECRLTLLSSSSASGRPNPVGPSDEVGALIVGDLEKSCGWRDIVVQKKNKKLKRIYETNKHFMQLQYPLMFPFGDEGFNPKIPLKTKKSNCRGKDKLFHDSGHAVDRDDEKCVTLREYYAYKLMVRRTEAMTPHLCGRLWQQYIVDAFTAVEQYRLDWVKGHQNTIRADLYNSIRDSIRKGDTDPSHIGKKIILPATHTGSRRYMSQYFKDSLAICRNIGHPSFFLTMTTNTKWPEIQRMLDHMPGVKPVDAPDVVARVFKMKLDQLVDLIKNKNYFGRCIGIMYVIEFQKRGLPHTHMLVWLHPDDRPKDVEKIDKLVSAEIPDKDLDPIAYNAVKNYMIHGPCGEDFSYSSCMAKGKCTRHFPKRYNGHTFFDDCGFPVYRRRKMNRNVVKNGIPLDNQFVVPYNRDLLLKFQCHINLEVCNNSRSLKYLFKYCLKGHDNATMLLQRKKDNPSGQDPQKVVKSHDEVKQYLDGRYICASEAAWRLLGFDIHYRYPAVERLPVHVKDGKCVSFKVNSTLDKVAEDADEKKK